MTAVIFSLSTRLKLRERATARLAADANAAETIMRDIETALGRAFPNETVLLVQDLRDGYRRRNGEYILQVELQRSANTSVARIVKLGDDDWLLAELRNWQNCRPEGLRHDLVLTVLEPKYDESATADPSAGNDPQAAGEIADGSRRKKLVALVYDDAQQFIGLEQTPGLEAALLDAVRFGVPTPASVADVLFSIYERLDLLLYRNSHVEDPASKEYAFSLGRFDPNLPPDAKESKLTENLRRWELFDSDDYRLRGVAMTQAEAAGLGDGYRDPVSFLLYLREQLEENPAMGPRLIPRLLRGSAHGDLHGRNVLVGRVEDSVLWPAVFDYGEMGRLNLVGWDFVKMETEFKIRAYPIVFRQLPRPGQFVAEIVKFERDLHQATEACRDGDRWPEPPQDNNPMGRLKWLLLKLRQQAGIHLGQRRTRIRDWLAEYYFLLTVYGLNSVRFENLTSQEKLGSYLSSGTACARYLFDRMRSDGPNDVIGSARGARQISHHQELSRIRRNWRDAADSEHDSRLKQAEVDLELLRAQFRYVLEIGHELVLVLEKQEKIQQARELAGQLEDEFTVLDDETFCRFGKLHKRAAIDAEAAGVVGAALEEFGIAENFYGKAYDLSHVFYPRINQLGLRFVRAGLLMQLCESADAARRAEGLRLAEMVQQDAVDMLNEAAVWHRINADDDIWAPASQAEAKFLARQWEESANAYRGVLKTLANRTTYIEIIRSQLELLVRSAKRAELIIDGPFADLDALFDLSDPA